MCRYTRSFEKYIFENSKIFKICPTHRGQFSSLHQSILNTLHHRENGGIFKIFFTNNGSCELHYKTLFILNAMSEGPQIIAYQYHFISCVQVL